VRNRWRVEARELSSSRRSRSGSQRRGQMAVNSDTSKRNNRVRNRKQSIHAARLSRRRLMQVGPAKPLWPDTSKPETFAEALDLQMRRHGENSDTLWRAIVRGGENLDPSTISAWRRGVKSPRFAQSFIYVE